MDINSKVLGFIRHNNSIKKTEEWLFTILDEKHT